MATDEDDGRPTMREALDAMRGGPVPDLSGPASFGRTFGALAGGADPDELLAALKGAQLPSVPLAGLERAARASEGMRWCKRCARPEPASAGCPNQSLAEASAENLPSLPADPFTPGQQAGIAAMDIYDDLLGAGMPLASVERIIAHMLADLIERA